MNAFLCKWRLAVIYGIDICMVILSWFSTFLLCNDLRTPPPTAFSFLPYIVITQGISFYFCGLYRGVWRFASIHDLIRILKSVISVVTIILLAHLINVAPFPPVIPINYGILLILFLSGPRIIFRWFNNYQITHLKGQRVLIAGAGETGEMLVRELSRLHSRDYQLIAFIDDNPMKQGQEIHGIRVRGTCQDIPKLVKTLQIDLILIAMPVASSAQMRRVVQLCQEAKTTFRTMPSLRELATGKISINDLREVSLEDLLGREQIILSRDQINNKISNKVVAVTGAGGSIGSELCLQLASFSPKKLLIIDNCEYNLYFIDKRLREYFPHLDLQTYLFSITDRPGINKIFSTHYPELIFHAAAYKHVPLLESQLHIGIHNNLIGTRIVAEAASKNNCQTFIYISTDKAVNPINLMGATKRAAEIFCHTINHHSNTRFITVRFGNVLDSKGSVVPLFREQIRKGGPLTVTHPKISRFFMTIREASQLILQAASLGKGGEIFVLDMGEPIKIRYLAEQMIKLSGKKLGEDIEINYIGLRPGEKLYEELFYPDEELSSTLHKKIHQAKSHRVNYDYLINLLNELESAHKKYDEKKMLSLLQHLIPEYQSTALQHKIEGQLVYN